MSVFIYYLVYIVGITSRKNKGCRGILFYKGIFMDCIAKRILPKWDPVGFYRKYGNMLLQIVTF